MRALREKEEVAMQELAEYIKDLKEQQKKLKKQGLAVQLNVDEQTVSRWSSGEEIPDDESCIRLAFIAGDDPAKVLILKYFSSSSNMSRPFWEKVYIKYRYGRTFAQAMSERSPYDRRNGALQFNGDDRRKAQDRRRGLDRRLLLAS